MQNNDQKTRELVEAIFNQLKLGEATNEPVYSDADFSSEIETINQLRVEILARKEKGLFTGFPGFHSGLIKLIRFAPGIILLIGQPSHGKSTFLLQQVVHFSKNLKQNWLLCQFEDLPNSRLVHGTLQGLWHGTKPGFQQNDAESEQVLDEMDKRITCLNPGENSRNIHTIISHWESHAETLAKRGEKLHGVTLDPMNELDVGIPKGISTSDWVSMQLSLVRKFSRDHDCMVALCAHPVKIYPNESGRTRLVQLNDAANSHTYRSKCDIGLVIHREYHADMTSRTTMHIQKVRYADWGKIGSVELQFNPTLSSFVPE